MPLILAVCLWLATQIPGDRPSTSGNDPDPIVLVLNDNEVLISFNPLSDETFGENGQRGLDYEFTNAGREVAVKDVFSRRKVDRDESDGPVIPLGLGKPISDGGACIVLEMVQPEGQAKAPISKGKKFSLRLRAVDSKKLFERFGPGVYESRPRLVFRSNDPLDTMIGDCVRNLRLILVIPGRRVTRLSVSDNPAVGQRGKVGATIEEILAPGGESVEGDRLRIEVVPEGETAATLDLPWPVPAGAWDPRNRGPNGTERTDWAVPSAWLDEPLLVDAGTRSESSIVDPDNKSEAVSKTMPRTVVSRQTFRLPPFFAPGTMRVQVVPSASDRVNPAEIPAWSGQIRSGLLATPGLAFVNDRIVIRAALSRGKIGVAEPPETIKVRIDRPNSGPKFCILSSKDSKSRGYASYRLKSGEEQPTVTKPGSYKITPDTGNPALDAALGGEVVVFAALAKDDRELATRKRVVFLEDGPPFHWPLIAWLESYKIDSRGSSADTKGALRLNTALGPEEIRGVSISLPLILVPDRQRPHDREKDGKIYFDAEKYRTLGQETEKAAVAEAAKASRGPWNVTAQDLTLDYIVDIKSLIGRPSSPSTGPRERFARFVVAGIGADNEQVGRIFREPIHYKVASHWEYYREWAWIPGLIILAFSVWWYIKHVAKKARPPKKPKDSASALSPSSAKPSTTRNRISAGWKEPEPPPSKTATPEPRRELPKDPGPPSKGGKKRL